VWANHTHVHLILAILCMWRRTLGTTGTGTTLTCTRAPTPSLEFLRTTSPCLPLRCEFDYAQFFFFFLGFPLMPVVRDSYLFISVVFSLFFFCRSAYRRKNIAIVSQTRRSRRRPPHSSVRAVPLFFCWVLPLFFFIFSIGLLPAALVLWILRATMFLYCPHAAASTCISVCILSLCACGFPTC
jgi:hypothetical protein